MSLLQSKTPTCTHIGLGSSAFARRYSQNRFFFLFLRLLRCFSSPGSLRSPIQLTPVQQTVHKVSLCGFPHSDICGSMCICHSPQLFAAYHVFHRLSVPRHPPCALFSLTNNLGSGLLRSADRGSLLPHVWGIKKIIHDNRKFTFYYMRSKGYEEGSAFE